MTTYPQYLESLINKCAEVGVPRSVFESTYQEKVKTILPNERIRSIAFDVFRSWVRTYGVLAEWKGVIETYPEGVNQGLRDADAALVLLFNIKSEDPTGKSEDQLARDNESMLELKKIAHDSIIEELLDNLLQQQLKEFGKAI